jgi:hypothetical protein
VGYQGEEAVNEEEKDGKAKSEELKQASVRVLDVEEEGNDGENEDEE